MKVRITRVALWWLDAEPDLRVGQRFEITKIASDDVDAKVKNVHLRLLREEKTPA